MSNLKDILKHTTSLEVKTALLIALDHGWIGVRTGSNHIKLTHPRGGMVIVSATPRRSTYIKQKILADIRREEKKWQHSQRKS